MLTSSTRPTELLLRCRQAHRSLAPRGPIVGAPAARLAHARGVSGPRSLVRMKSGSRTGSGPGAASRRYWPAALAAALVSALTLLLFTLASDRKSQSVVPSAAPPVAAVVSPVIADPAWSRLSVVERRILEPLSGTWPTMTAEQQDKWRLIADSSQNKPQQVQRRLAARIAEWVRLSPRQRAHARLNFLELAKRYNPRQRQAQWQAYQTAKPNPEQAAIGRRQPVVVSPAFVQASPGATTVLLSQLFDLPALDQAAEDGGEAAPEPPVGRWRGPAELQGSISGAGRSGTGAR